MAENLYKQKIVIMATDGRLSYSEAISMMEPCNNEELYEWLNLSLRIEIYENSPEHQRLNELSRKYETPAAIHFDIW